MSISFVVLKQSGLTKIRTGPTPCTGHCDARHVPTKLPGVALFLGKR